MIYSGSHSCCVVPRSPPPPPPSSKAKSQGKVSPTAILQRSHLLHSLLPLPSRNSLETLSIPPASPAPPPGTGAPGYNCPCLMAILQHHTSFTLLAAADLQGRPGGHLEHFSHAVLRLSRTLHVAKGSDPRGHVPTFLRLNRLLLGVRKLLNLDSFLESILLYSLMSTGGRRNS